MRAAAVRRRPTEERERERKKEREKGREGSAQCCRFSLSLPLSFSTVGHGHVQNRHSQLLAMSALASVLAKNACTYSLDEHYRMPLRLYGELCKIRGEMIQI
jgi:hypothetical protein